MKNDPYSYGYGEREHFGGRFKAGIRIGDDDS
jgi:hypothetical protein